MHDDCCHPAAGCAKVTSTSRLMQLGGQAAATPIPSTIHCRLTPCMAPCCILLCCLSSSSLTQLAYTVYQPPATFEACIKQWGVDSIQAITKTVPAFYSNAVAYVMRVGKERLFVVFKGSDATNWIQNMECAHTEPLGDLFAARGSDLRLHSGFYAGWKALEADVRAAVLSFVKEVRGTGLVAADCVAWRCGFVGWSLTWCGAPGLDCTAQSERVCTPCVSVVAQLRAHCRGRLSQQL